MKRMLAAALLGALVVPAARTMAAERPTVNDVTQLNPIVVERIVAPTSIGEVQTLVREHAGPVSIGGARHSMGGQIATENSLFLDMRKLDRVLALDVEHRTITVEAGITWRTIQEAIDPHDLSVKVMQSYASFTVGGSLSVNAHGRYVGQGSLIGSVRAIKLVLADGTLVNASRTENAELFRGAIGGYGSLGVIVEATLDLVPNQKIERTSKRMRLADYKKYFVDEIRGSKTAVFHNADIYPPAYDQVIAITWSETDRPLTVLERLTPVTGSHWRERLAYLWMSEAPFGKESRRTLIDPMRLRGTPVVWRNHEASYDVGELEPISRTRSTYALEEYFIPVDRFDEFAAAMKVVLASRAANVINVSIRHAEKDDESLMAWAHEECFAFVIYYKQGVRPDQIAEVGDWTRELIDAALASGGTYYLPYQLHATEDQFRRAYPRAAELFALKAKVDPANKFRNKLWDRYYHAAAAPPPSAAAVPAAAPPDELAEAHDAALRASLRERKGYVRAASQTYLTLPEWYIVFSADEVADWMQREPPSAFPYVRSVAQFWRIYAHVLRATWADSEWGYQLMIAVIGPSYTLEYLVKSIYENLIGRLGEITVGGGEWPLPTAEDRFLAAVWQDYAKFIHATPWYEYPFASKLRALWSLPGAIDRTLPRRVERRLGATLGLGVKSVWGWAIRASSQSAYDPEAETIEAWTRRAPGVEAPGVIAREDLDERSELLKLPRYEPFTAAVVALASRGVHFVEIAGNDRILVTIVAPREWSDTRDRGDVLLEWPILTRPEVKRVALTVAVPRLDEVLPSLAAEHVTIDHVFDF